MYPFKKFGFDNEFKIICDVETTNNLNIKIIKFFLKNHINSNNILSNKKAINYRSIKYYNYLSETFASILKNNNNNVKMIF